MTDVSFQCQPEDDPTTGTHESQTVDRQSWVELQMKGGENWLGTTMQWEGRLDQETRLIGSLVCLVNVVAWRQLDLRAVKNTEGRKKGIGS